jgi:hypothetical protein
MDVEVAVEVNIDPAEVLVLLPRSSGKSTEDEIMLPVVGDPGGRHPHGGERWVTRVGPSVGW